ncbi:MAG: glycosyltransferase [Bacillota bacterium]
MVRLVDGRASAGLEQFADLAGLAGQAPAFDYNRGLARLWTGDFGGAADDFGQAAASPQGPQASSLGLAIASWLGGRPAEARRALAAASAAMPGLPRLTSFASVLRDAGGAAPPASYAELVAAQVALAREVSPSLVLSFLANPPALCGGQLVFYEWVNRMAARGHQVSVLSHGGRPSWKQVAAPFLTLPLSESLAESTPAGDASFGIYWDQVADLVNASERSVPFFLFQGDPYIFERTNPQLSDQLSRNVSDAIDHFYGRPVHLLVVSNLLRDLLKVNYDRESEVIENAVEPAHFFPRPKTSRPGRPRVVIMGPGDTPFKGIDDIKAALRMVKERGLDFDVVHVSPNSSRDPAFEGLFVESPPREEIGRIMAEADLFISGSHYESFAMPPLEAMASGTAVVTAANDGVRQYAVDGQNCLMGPVGDVGAMAEAIQRALTDEGLRHRLATAGLTTSARFTWDNSFDRLEDVVWRQTVALQPDLRPLARSVFEAELAERGQARRTISVCLIARNEEANLKRCLASVEEVADEVVFGETGSTDCTALLGIMFGARVKPVRWNDDFAAARNEVLEDARGDWVLVMDADEELDPESVLPLLRLTAPDTEADAHYLNVLNYVGTGAGRPADVSRVLRLFRNRPEYRFQGRIHEQVLPSILAAGGRVSTSVVRLNHYGYLATEVAAKDKIHRNVKLLRDTLQERPGDLYRRFQLAQELTRAGHFEPAADEFDQVARALQAPDYGGTGEMDEDFAPVAAQSAIEGLVRGGRVARALQAAEVFAAAWPDYRELTVAHGQALLAMGRPVEAVKRFLQVLAGGPSPAKYAYRREAIQADAWRWLGQAYEELGQVGEAVTAYRQALGLYPGEPGALGRLASLLVRAGPPEQGVTFLQGLLSSYDPLTRSEAVCVLAKTLVAEGLSGLAEAPLQAVLADPAIPAPATATCRYWLGLAFEGQNRYGQAADVFASVVDASGPGAPPDTSLREAVWHEALCLLLSERPAEAEKILQTVAEGALGQARLYKELARALAAPGQGEPASSREGTQARRELARPDAARAFSSLADRLWTLGEAKAFLALAGLADRIFTTPGRADRELGKFFFLHGAPDEALGSLIRAVRAGDEDGESLAFLGLIAAGKGLTDDAVEFLRRSIETDPERVQSHIDLARVMAGAGRRGEALQAVRDALAGRFAEHPGLSALEAALASGAACRVPAVP